MDTARTKKTMDHTKLVIVKAGCKTFGHELLNSLSVHAYGLELGIPVIDHPVAGGSILPQYWNKFYARYVQKAHRESIVRAHREITYLPPTKNITTPQSRVLYFFGWPFRNPEGLKKHRVELLNIFSPTPSEKHLVQNTLVGTEGKMLIGVHLRQEPFKGFEGGEFLLPIERVEAIVEEYLAQKGLDKKDVALVVVSDHTVPKKAFGGFELIMTKGDTKENLFLLSKCSVIIGDNSIYSNLAAWFGNTVHVVATPEPVDWHYYRDNDSYFENKYATFAL
jgi:hypothetical protein